MNTARVLLVYYFAMNSVIKKKKVFFNLPAICLAFLRLPRSELNNRTKEVTRGVKWLLSIIYYLFSTRLQKSQTYT